MSCEDREIVEAFGRNRDDASFRRLYRRHTPMLFGLAVRLTRSQAEAEELIQEAWVRAIERHDRFDERSKYSTWVAGILLNCHREAQRRNVRGPVPLDEEPHLESAFAASSSPLRSNPVRRIDVERGLQRLPAGYREVVILHDINGYTHEQIGAMLGIEQGTSKSQLARGRARLRELLTPPPSRDDSKRGTS